jgi:hypothetical protein
MIVLPSGAVQLTAIVPYEGQAEVLKLGHTSGLLLEASVSAVDGVIK